MAGQHHFKVNSLPTFFVILNQGITFQDIDLKLEDFELNLSLQGLKMEWMP